MTLEERFYEKVEMIPDGCWVWTARCDKDGYGKIRQGSRMVRSHRVAWELSFGKIPRNTHVLHKCDNPCCVNPNHLFLGDQKSNMMDRDIKNRTLVGEKHGRSKLTPEEILSIRQDSRIHDVIAKEHGLSQSHVTQIKNRKYWKHI